MTTYVLRLLQTDEAGISQTPNCTANRLSGLLARIRSEKSDNRGRNAKKKKSVVKKHRIQVRWHHYDKTMGKYLPVRLKNGGGNRFIAYLPSDPPTLPDILQKASELYFPNGQNRFAGQLNKLKKDLTDSSGDVITEFPYEGTVSDHLNAKGMYPSSTFFRRQTKFVDEHLLPMPMPALVLSDS